MYVLVSGFEPRYYVLEFIAAKYLISLISC